MVPDTKLQDFMFSYRNETPKLCKMNILFLFIELHEKKNIIMLTTFLFLEI